jgi:signal peptidase II
MSFFGFKNFIKKLPVIFSLAVLDQLSKTYLIAKLKATHGMTIKASSFFSFVYAWNHGISFGFLGEFYQYSNYAFLGINCIIVGYLIAMLNSSKSDMQNIGISIIIGGALGNITDRIFRGAVFDFLYFHYKEYSFPAFNLADFFINIGVLIVLIALFRKK